MIIRRFPCHRELDEPYEVIIAADEPDVVIRLKADQLGYDGSSGAIINVVIESGVEIYASNSQNPALSTGAFPGSTLVSIQNYGTISGAGGKGGNGVHVGTAGAPGGTAFEALVPVSISNYGIIRGGGGGGGGGSNEEDEGISGGGGGGGGQGRVGGAGGAAGSGWWPNEDGLPGNAGSPEAPGTGGQGGVTFGYAGGSGGAWGMAGVRGVGPYGRPGGTEGKYADGNHNITWLHTGVEIGDIA